MAHPINTSAEANSESLRDSATILLGPRWSPADRSDCRARARAWKDADP